MLNFDRSRWKRCTRPWRNQCTGEDVKRYYKLLRWRETGVLNQAGYPQLETLPFQGCMGPDYSRYKASTERVPVQGGACAV